MFVVLELGTSKELDKTTILHSKVFVHEKKLVKFAITEGQDWKLLSEDV
jgi:hypothetical protein